VTLTLRSGDWRAELRPEIGGALAGLWLGETEILRAMPTGSSDPLDAACFPLVPYCNRIRDGAFEWQGREVHLPANFPPERHSLHGLGWQVPWAVTSEAGFKCALEHRYDSRGAWPWAYDAEQRVRLGSKGCAITLDVTNRGDTPMPCGLGFHPYFRRRSETRVQFRAGGMLAVGGDLIPTGEIVEPGRFADWQQGTALPTGLVDHCFDGWDGSVAIADDCGMITMTARGAPFLHVYAPEEGSALCFEPVGHAPDAVNRAPTEMTVLPPGCTAALTMLISAVQ
jgi:aldose 1-epimerase